MADFAKATQDAIVAHITGEAVWTAPAATYVQLHDGDPGEDALLNVIAGVARVECTSWNPVAGSAATNAVLVQFTNGTGSTINPSHISIWDAVTAGNALYKGNMTNPRVIPDGSTLDFDPGNISMGAD